MKGLPGFRDFYPEPVPTPDSWSLDLRRHIFDTWRGTAERYGFREYDGPPIEELELYTQKAAKRSLANCTTLSTRATAMSHSGRK